MVEFWNTGSNRTLWSQGSDGISLRDEVSYILRNQEGRIGLLRRVQRDANTKPILCTCRDAGGKGKPSVHICDKCLNTGYRWVEEWIYYHKLSAFHGGRQMQVMESIKQPGSISAPMDIFYLEYHTMPTVLDSIVEVRLDAAGKPVVPIARSAFHDIKAIEEYRLDGARIEFYQCSVAQITVGFFGQPLAERNPSLGRVSATP